MKKFWLKYKDKLNLGVRLVIFAATLYYILMELRQGDHPVKPGNLLNFDVWQYGVLVFIFLLMFVNWGIEAWKWRVLVMKFEDISMGKSLRAVLAGMGSTAWVPNRLGQFIGRTFFVSPGAKGKAVSSTIVANLSQLLVTLVLGGLAAFLWASPVYHISGFWLFPIIVLDGVLIYLFFFLNRFSQKVIPREGRLNNSVSYLNELSKFELLAVLLAALSRYLVYVFQFILLIYLFNIDIPVKTLSLRLMSVFFIQSILPALPITELGTRGASVLFVFHDFDLNQAALLSAAYLLWLINVILPMGLGAIFLLRIKKQNQ